MAKEKKGRIQPIFYANDYEPLKYWDKDVKNGHIRRVLDDDVKSLVLEISGTNVATTYITCPIKPRASLGIKLPFLILIVKNMKKYFTFEIQILDDKNMRRRFRVSNFQSTTKVRPFCTTMPIGLSSGWNQIQFNLADFTRRAYGSTYIETMRLQIHANVRIRRIYFADRLYTDDEMPNEFKMFLPPGGGKQTGKGKIDEKSKKEETKTDKQVEEKPPQEVEELNIKNDMEPSAAPPTPVPEESSPIDVEKAQADVAPDELPAEGELREEESPLSEGYADEMVESPSGEIGAISEVTEEATTVLSEVTEALSENQPAEQAPE